MIAVVAFIIGLVVGSFLNIVISRYPQEQVIAGRSRCPHCRHALGWYDLVPLVGFFVLGRRCRYCGQRISWQYPIVEAVSGLGFGLIAILVWPNLFFLVWLLVLFSLSVLTAAYDARHQIIPDSFLLIFLVWVVGGSILFSRATIQEQALAGLALGSFFLILYFLSGSRWLGGGDVKLAFILGLWLGWPAVVMALFGAYIVGFLTVVPLLFLKRATLKSRIAFGPFLIISSWVAFLWGGEIVSWYLSLIT